MRKLLLSFLAAIALPIAVNADTEGVKEWLNEADLAKRNN